MFRFFCLIFLFPILIRPALADCGVFDAEDSVYRYVCAYGTGKSESEAVTRARRDGEAQAAKMIDNTMEFRSLSVETVNDVDVVANTASSGRADVSPLSVVREFTPVCRKGACSANILYRFPKKEIERQKELLKTGKNVRRPAARTLGRKKASTGLLKLQSNVPGAAVRIDGILFSPKSTDVDINLEEGVHEVFVEHPHYRSFRKEVRIVRGGDFPLYARLGEARAEVRLETLPVDGAVIFLNGEKIGTTPKSFTLNPAQTNEIRLTHPEMQDASLSLTGVLKKDQSESYAVRMTEKPSYVSIDTSPSGASVYMDRNPFGKTPVRNRQVSRGEHAFTLVLNGYENQEAEFTAVGGKTYVKHFELKPRKSRKTTLIPSASAVVTPAAASGASGPQYQPGEKDKYHSFREKRPTRRPFAVPDAASREEMLMALMKWDYAANLLRVRTSYKEEDGGILLFAQTYFDNDAFREAVDDTFIPVLEQISDKKGSASIDNACTFTGENECLNRRNKKVCRKETASADFWSPAEEKIVCTQESVCSMTPPPGLNRSCYPDYRETRTVSWNEGKYDRDHRLIIREGQLKDLGGTIYVLKAPGREAYHKFRSGLRSDPRFSRISPVEKVRLSVVLHLKSGKTAARQTLLNLRKFIRADMLPESAGAKIPRKLVEERNASAGVIFYPRIEESPEEYKNMFFFDGIKADDITSVSVSLERAAS